MDINEDYYLSVFESMLNSKGMKNFKKIEGYFEQLKLDVLNCIENISKEKILESILELITLDEKLSLLYESLHYIEYYEMTEIELIEMVEKDYKEFNKENCGYTLEQSPPFSLIFPSNFKEQINTLR
ncbi:hypothetical protein ABE905_13735 [Enterococcus durans]|uniref:DUF7006 family protein n=1 Tax=Enterococcus durans TaxID=53345 RepID=UPI003D6A38DF